jgi:hypothetical protein
MLSGLLRLLVTRTGRRTSPTHAVVDPRKIIFEFVHLYGIL